MPACLCQILCLLLCLMPSNALRLTAIDTLGCTCREPLARLLSHMRFMMMVHTRALRNEKWPGPPGSPPQRFNVSMFSGMPFETWRRIAPAVMDNYYVR